VPSNDDLGGGLAVPPTNVNDDRMIEATGFERAIALKEDTALVAGLNHLPVVEERTPPV
jgi:hypothetical protein